MTFGKVEVKPMKDQEPYTIEPFVTEASAYYEYYGKLHVVEKKWKILVNLQIKEIFFQEMQITRFLEVTRKLCSLPILLPDARSPCTNFLKITQAEVNKLRFKIGSMGEVAKINTRYQRGLVDGLGSIAKSLIGTMDAADEARIDEQLGNLREGQSIIKNSVEQQLQIVNSTLNELTDVREKIDRNERTLLEASQKIERKLNSHIERIIIRDDVDEHFSLLTAIIHDLMDDVESMQQFFADIRQGKLHAGLLSTKRLIDLLKEANGHLPRGFSFPLNLDYANTKSWEELIELQAYYAQEAIVVVIQVPLVDAQIFRVNKVWPIPKKINNNTFVHIDVANPFAIIEDEGQHYLIKNEAELNKCKYVGNEYFCDTRTPIFAIRQHSPCEVMLYARPTTKMGNCEVRYATLDRTLLLKLQNSNAWLYVAPTMEYANIQCDSGFEKRISLQNSGIFELRETCKISTADFVIQALEVRQSIADFNFASEVNLTNYNTSIDTEKLKMYSTIGLQQIIENPEDLRKMSTKLAAIRKDMSSEPLHMNSVTPYHHIVPSVILGVISLILLILSAILVVKCQKWRKEATTIFLPQVGYAREPRTRGDTEC